MIWTREATSLFKAEWKGTRYMVSGDSQTDNWMLIIEANKGRFELIATGLDRLELMQRAENMSADEGEG